MLMDEWWEVEFSFIVEIGWFKHVLFVKMNTILTECVHTRQKLSEIAKSWILMTLGIIDILMGGVHYTKYFWTGITLRLMGAHPNFEVTKKN